MSNTAIQATNLPGSQAMDLSFFGMFANADFVVKCVLLLLFAASIWSWSIIIMKYLSLRTIRTQSDKFERDFWASEALDKFHEKVKKKATHPMANMFTVAMEEWFRSKTKETLSGRDSFKAGIRERVGQVMNVARNRELESLEKGLGFLATVGTSAPFIGLFGTVWGIMHSFHSIALSKNTSLVAVAPGIAEALFATAVGLLAAIPAVIAYNTLSNQLAAFSGKLDDFTTEYLVILSRQIDAQ